MKNSPLMTVPCLKGREIFKTVLQAYLCYGKAVDWFWMYRKAYILNIIIYCYILYSILYNICYILYEYHIRIMPLPSVYLRLKKILSKSQDKEKSDFEMHFLKITKKWPHGANWWPGFANGSDSLCLQLDAPEPNNPGEQGLHHIL